jgi:hypothetical protein
MSNLTWKIINRKTLRRLCKYHAGQKILPVIVCQLKKKKKISSVLYCHHDYRLDYERYFLGGKSKLNITLSFILHRTFTSGYLCTIVLILFIHVGFVEYLSFKQFKLIVKMTRIERGVTIPKGLFTLYLNVECQESDGQNFLAAIVLSQRINFGH